MRNAIRNGSGDNAKPSVFARSVPCELATPNDRNKSDQMTVSRTLSKLAAASSTQVIRSVAFEAILSADSLAGFVTIKELSSSPIRIYAILPSVLNKAANTSPLVSQSLNIVAK